MLLVSPAAFSDILVGKLLVVLVFQLTLTSIVMAIMGGFAGNLSLAILFVLLGSLFSLSLRLLFGCLFNSVQTASTVSGFVLFILAAGGIFVGQLGQLLSAGLVLKLLRVIPSYYLADGIVNASQNLGTTGGTLLDISIIIGSTIVFLVISTWALRRQSSVLALV